MSLPESLSQSLEDYLEAILRIERRQGSVRSIDEARHLDVSKPSVSHAMKKLCLAGHLRMAHDHSLHLTASGRAIAESIDERHHYFRDRLIAAGVDPVLAEHDACQLEHALSPESFAKLKEMLEKQ